MGNNPMNEHYPFVNPPLPYEYDALEPYIDTQTMYLHHDRYLQKQVAVLNELLKDYPELQNMSLEELLSYPENLPEETRQSILDYAGGVYSHIIFFNGMTDPSSSYVAEFLLNAVLQEYGSLPVFFDLYKEEALSIFGSGNAWLVVDPNGRLEIVTLPNQVTPIALNLCPIAIIDVWEHAYYSKHFNDRAAYLEDWFKVVNWEQVEELYIECLREIENH